MALTFTPTLFTPVTSAATKTLATGSFTPAVGELIQLWATARRNGATDQDPDLVISAQTHGGTWAWTRTRLLSADGGSTSGACVCLFQAICPTGGNVAGTVTIDSQVTAGLNPLRWRIAGTKWAGHSGVIPTNIKVQYDNITPTATSLALTTSPKANSAVIGGGLFQGVTNPGVTPGTGWTEAVEAGDAVNSSLELEYDLSAPSGTLTWSSAGAGATLLIAVEVEVHNYTLTADPRTYAWTGVAAGLKASRKLAATPTVFNWSAQPTILRVSRLPLVAAPGAFSWAGVAAGLRETHSLVAAPGAFSWAGVAARLAQPVRHMSAAPVAFDIAASPVLLQRGHGMVAVAGSFTLAGASAALRASRTMPVAAGAFLVAPQTTRLAFGRRLAAGPGSYSWTGVAAGAIVHRKMLVAQTTFLVGASLATKLAYNRRFGVAPGAFILSGVAVGFPPHVRRIYGAPTEFAVSSMPVGMVYGRRLKTALGAFLWAGHDILFHVPRKMLAEPASFLIHPVAMRFGRGHSLHTETGHYVIKGTNITFGEPGVEMMALVEGTIRPDIDGQIQLKLFSKTASTIWIKVPTVGFLFEVD